MLFKQHNTLIKIKDLYTKVCNHIFSVQVFYFYMKLLNFEVEKILNAHVCRVQFPLRSWTAFLQCFYIRRFSSS